MKRRTVRGLACACLVLALAFAAPALAVTADEEAARIEGLAAMEPVPAAGTAVQPLIAIEKTWDIEDTHAEAVTPLVTSMSFCRGTMGRDAESRTFYASLGTDVTQWPELALTAGGADGLSVAWVDDYAWDEPASAVRDGTAYRLIAWTDSEYEYVSVVFTGLPMVIIRTGDGAEPGEEYGPCLAGVTAADYDPVLSVAQIHTRGGGYKKDIKKSYRLEFAQKKKRNYGYKKRSVSLLGMPEDTDWILINNTGDSTLMRNLIGFRLWDQITEGQDVAFARLQGCLVELCLNDEYMGIYTLQQRVKPKRELLENGFTEADYSARLTLDIGVEQRPVEDAGDYIYSGAERTVLELRYLPKGKTAEDCFAVFQDFLLLADKRKSLDDDAFLKLAYEHLDMRALMQSFLFYEGVILSFDNIRNNVFVWAVRRDGKLLYYFSPWDMDTAFKLSEDILRPDPVIAMRLLDLNAPGVRSLLWEEWRKMRSGPLSDDNIYQLTDEMGGLLDRSGALAREKARWGGYEHTGGVDTIREFLLAHLPEMEMRMTDIWPEE